MDRLAEDMRDQFELSVNCLNALAGTAGGVMEAAEQEAEKQSKGRSGPDGGKKSS